MNIDVPEGVNWTPFYGAFYPPRGHRFFQAKDGRIAVADESGEFPQDTDDGILWVDFTRPVFCLDCIDFDVLGYDATPKKKALYSLPVVDDEGRRYGVPIMRPHIEEVAKLMGRVPTWEGERGQIEWEY